MRYNFHTVSALLCDLGWRPVGYAHDYTTFDKDGVLKNLERVGKPNTPYSTYRWAQIKRRFGITPEDLSASEW